MSVTIVIPFYNAEKYLADAIRSVFAQTHQNWELVLLDDGSTDNSLKIAKSIRDPRVRVVSDGKNKKLATRLNEVVKFAKYNYIARMDADDLMSPRRIETQYHFMEKNDDFDLISTGTYSILNDDKLVGYRGMDAKGVDFYKILNKKVGILHASILARKSWFERNKYDEKLPLAQDTDMWLRTSKKNDLKINIISKPLYIYREENNITAKKMLKAYKIERTVFANYIDNTLFKFIFILKSYLKTLIISILSKLNYIEFLQKRRNQIHMSENLNKEFNEILIKIKSTKVPGID